MPVDLKKNNNNLWFLMKMALRVKTLISFTFGFLLHQKTGHTLLFSHHEGNISRFIRGYHLEDQAVHSPYNAHLIQIIILKQVVWKPPFPIGDTRVWQLNLKDGVFPSGHSNVAEFSNDSHMLWGWMGWWMMRDQRSVLCRASRHHDYEGICLLNMSFPDVVFFNTLELLNYQQCI